MNNSKTIEGRKTIAVWFSCGAASAVAAKLTIEKYGFLYDVKIFNTPVFEEHKDNIRFKNDCEKWFGQPIITATNKGLGHNSAKQVWTDRGYMSGNKGAPCTGVLKKEARYQTELIYEIAFHVLGFTAEEKHRHDRFTTFERKNVLPVLIDAGMSKQMCFDYIQEAGIALPEIYEYFDNANWVGCVKASGVDYWQRVRQHFPEIFNDRAKQSREIGCKLTRINGKRIFLDELPIEATGRKSSRFDCGIFCDRPKHKKQNS